MQNTYKKALRDFQDYADDVSRASHRTFEDGLRRLASTLVPGTPLGDVVAELPEVDFDDWYAERLQTVRSMVGSGELQWPINNLERLALQVELIRRLKDGKPDIIDFTHDFMWVGKRFDDNIGEFNAQIFRPFVRDFLRHVHETPQFTQELRRKPAMSESEPQIEPDLLLFISHSSSDVALAKALIVLLEKGLKISARRIRCTSVDGYRLPVGSDTNEVLRTEVFGAQVFLAILTPSSMASHFVLFELGARWGARRPLFPLLGAGLRPGDLQHPLSGLNALTASNADHLRQLLEDTASALSLALEPMASFSAEVDAVVAAAGATLDSAS